MRQNYSVLARALNDYNLKIKKTLLIKERVLIVNNNETSVILNFFNVGQQALIIQTVYY